MSSFGDTARAAWYVLGHTAFGWFGSDLRASAWQPWPSGAMTDKLPRRVTGRIILGVGVASKPKSTLPVITGWWVARPARAQRTSSEIRAQAPASSAHESAHGPHVGYSVSFVDGDLAESAR
jgi:hypothetical protein